MKQPSARDCFVCGAANPFGLQLAFYNSEPGQVTAEYTVPAHYQGYPGVVHGGVVAAMLDEAAGRAHMTGETPRFMYTARLEVRYRKNVPINQPLHLVGHTGKNKGRTATASSEIYDSQGTLLAEAQAVLVDIPDHVIDSADLEEIGWKIYPDG